MHKKYLERNPEKQQTVGDLITLTATGGRRIKDIFAITVHALERHLGVSQLALPADVQTLLFDPFNIQKLKSSLT